MSLKPHYHKPETGFRIVSIKLWGGLCNRLFQIACCLGYAEKYNLAPVFYKYLFENNTHTDGNETINIIKQLLPELDIRDIDISESDFYVIDIAGDFACKYIDLQLPIHTDKNILLKGYFQSEKYFPMLENNKFLYSFVKKLIANNIIHINADGYNADSYNADMPNTDGCNNRYFLHIRMGDYMNHYLHYLGYKKYLEASIKYILDRNPNAVFLICSNEKDKEKILQELKFDNENNNYNVLSGIKYEFESPHGFNGNVGKAIFEIDINPELNPLITLTNMAMCAGGICVNSSFSWFGAYLSRMVNIEKNNIINTNIIIMPKHWFNDSYISREMYKDIYPQWDTLVVLDI